MIEHIQEDLKKPYHSPQSMRIAIDVFDTIPFITCLEAGELRYCRRYKLNHLRRLKSRVANDTGQWYEHTPDRLKSTTGAFDIAIATYLSRFFGIKADRWLSQMSFCFPNIGSRSQQFTYPVKDAPSSRENRQGCTPLNTFPAKPKLVSELALNDPIVKKNPRYGLMRLNKPSKVGPNARLV